jgi:putative oxidoreductase
MLNPLPELLSFTQLGPFILRLVIGLVFLDLGLLKFRSEKARWIESFKRLHLNPAGLLVPLYALIEIAGGILLMLGAWTQIAALAFVILVGLEFYVEYKDSSVLKRDFTFYLLVLAIAASLLFTGAGSYSFDIPL